ncbi:MAG: hypothetical protein HY875_17815 [Chloroflexi bacterium]|nr:hypothetical protein [Chloroflexota bacterium]
METTLELILRRLMEEKDFRAKVIYWPDTALAGYDLSEEERLAFRTRNFESLPAAQSLRERLRNTLDTSGF